MIQDLLPEDYSKYVGIAQILVARDLTKTEEDHDRRKKMVAAQKERIGLIAKQFGLQDRVARSEAGLLAVLNEADWTSVSSRTLLVDVAFSNPFAPYYLKYAEKDRNRRLAWLAQRLGLEEGSVDEMVSVAKSAKKAHRKWFQNPLVWTAITVGGGLLLGGLGFLAAPAIGTMVGEAAGLYGAAATAHGLALLGGGSLAVGGAGMAGGLAVVTAAGAGVGTVTGGGAALLMALTHEAAIAEIAKLQTTFAFVALPENKSLARQIMSGLAHTIKDLGKDLQKAQSRNDKGAPNIKLIDGKLEGARKAEAWMRMRLTTA